MMRRAETEAHQIDRAQVELDEASLAQPRKHPLGQLEVVEPEARDVRIKRQRMRAANGATYEKPPYVPTYASAAAIMRVCTSRLVAGVIR